MENKKSRVLSHKHKKNKKVRGYHICYGYVEI